MRKKLLKCAFMSMLFLLSICTVKTVHAEKYTGQAIWPSEHISNIYIKKVKPNGYTKYQQARFIRRSEDNKFVYCLQPYAEIDNNLPYYDVIRDDYANVLGLSEAQWERVSLLAYYGYQYDQNGYNHSAQKWYAITQVMIWRTTNPESDIYFTDTLNGNRISQFESEMAEIERLVSDRYKQPSLKSEIVLPIGQTIEINDSNNVLNEYKITGVNNVTATINGNKLSVTANSIGDGSVTFEKKATKYEIPPIVYFSDHSQNVMRVGSYDPVKAKFTLKVIGGKVVIQKVDSESLTVNAQGNATLQGAVYGVFKEDGTKLTELTTNATGYVKSDYLSSIGKLYIQEIKPSVGYKLDSTKYYVELTSDNLEPTVQVKEEVIKGKIKITKFDNETNTCKAQGEATLFGAKYKIVNSKGEVVDTITIGDDCTATSKDLPYGNYKVIEEKSSVGYYIDVNSYNVFINSEKIFNVTSKEQVIKGKIKIKKVDSENNSCIAQGQASLKGAIYEILDLKGNVVDTITIGDDCTATSKYLPYGHYKIKEKTSSKGYYLDKNVYTVNIIEDIIINVTSEEAILKI